jgi:hypothetical protein
MEHDRNRLSECLTGDSDTKFRPVLSNGPSYRSSLGGPNILAMATKIATKFDHRFLNIIRQEKKP